MKNISKYKVDKSLLISLILLIIVSLISITSAQSLIPNSGNLALKQSLWYIAGFIVAFFIMFIGNNPIFEKAWFLYIIGIIALVLLLVFGEPINNAKCWFRFGPFTVQPSEFMKIFLIITLSSMVCKFNKDFDNPSLKEELFFLIKVFIVVLIPSVLTFMQPDTGVVLIYLLITAVILFISGIRYRWFIIAFGTLFVMIGVVLLIYFINTEVFIKIFGTSFFLRIDRLLDWSNQSGYQLQNGINAIGYGGLFGSGFNNTPVYFPEPQTDFIFAVFASNFGFIGSVLLIALLAFFNISLINIAIKNNSLINKYIISGMVGMLIYQQLQNIGMTFGLMPITGITLPFISYGGSSLLSYMIMIGIVFNISNQNLRYAN